MIGIHEQFKCQTNISKTNETGPKSVMREISSIIIVVVV